MWPPPRSSAPVRRPAHPEMRSERGLHRRRRRRRMAHQSPLMQSDVEMCCCCCKAFRIVRFIRSFVGLETIARARVGRRATSSNLSKCSSPTNDHPVLQLMTTLFFRPREPINSSTGKTTAVPPPPLLNGDEEPLLGSSRASPPPNGRSSNGTQRPIHFRRDVANAQHRSQYNSSFNPPPGTMPRQSSNLTPASQY